MRAIADTEHGRVAYDPRDLWIGRSLERLGEYNHGEIEAYRLYLRSGDTAIDAGANVGATALPMARLVGATGTVIAFEPQATAYELLRETIALNDLANVRAHCACVGAAPGEVTVPDMLASAGEIVHSGGLQALTGQGEGRKTPVVTVDSLGLDSLAFLKMDVEGAEPAVLMGSRETIAKHRPVIYYELHVDEHGLATAILARWGYRLWRHVPRLYRANNRMNAPFPWGEYTQDGKEAAFASINAIALPAERFDGPPDLESVRGEMRPSPWLSVEV